MDIKILSAEDVRQSLPMNVAIEAMKTAYSQFSSNQAKVPLRSRIDVATQQGVSLFMPALLGETNELAVKIVSVFPNNLERGEPTIYALVIVLDASSGRPLAVLEGGSLTAIRTGAASGAATDVLARPDSKTVAIFGSGVQARTQLEAVCTVREIEDVWVFSLDRPGLDAFIAEMTGSGPIPAQVKIAKDPDQAVEGADIICTATTSTTPVFTAENVKAGTHINAIGSFTPEMQEIDPAILTQARIVVDSREAVLAETGDLIIPIDQGLLSEDAIQAELGEILNGTEPGRTGPDEITLFKSVGIAVQDTAAAGRAIVGAIDRNLGQIVNL